MTEHVVVDVDPGIDDAYALAILIGAQKLGILKIVAIVCSAGNTSRKKACFNLVRVLITLNAYDIPVFEGTWHPIIRSQFYSRNYGYDGFGDIFDKPSNGLKLNTTEEFCHYIHTKFRPRKLTMLCFAPLTLTAGYLLRNSQRFFKEVWIMGGNNPDHFVPYWTFQRDPEAVDVVLKHVHAPITLVPYRLTCELGLSMTWRAQTLASIKQPFILIMNIVEHKNMNLRKQWIMPNAVMAIAYSFPETVLNSSLEMIAINRKFPAATKTGLLFRTLDCKRRGNVRILSDMDCKIYKKRLLETVNQSHGLSFKSKLFETKDEPENTDSADEYGWDSL